MIVSMTFAQPMFSRCGHPEKTHFRCTQISKQQSLSTWWSSIYF